VRAAWAQAREAWLLPLALPVGPASVPRPASAAGAAAGAGVLPRGADYLFSDQTGPSEQAAVVEAEVGAEAEREPRALGRSAGALVVQALGSALLLALVLAVVVALGGEARRRPWPRWAWGLRPAHRRARSWSIPEPPGGSAVR